MEEHAFVEYLYVYTATGAQHVYYDDVDEDKWLYSMLYIVMDCYCYWYQSCCMTCASGVLHDCIVAWTASTGRLSHTPSTASASLFGTANSLESWNMPFQFKCIGTFRY